MYLDGRIKPFHSDRYKAGHRATDYNKWLGAMRPYRIRYEEGFEPYVLVHRKYVPWYDERFVGYRKNKVVHLLHLNAVGMQWVVHPRAFAVHSPHPRARTWKVTHKTGLWDQLATLYDDVKAGLEAGNYIPSSMYSCGSHLVSSDRGARQAGGGVGATAHASHPPSHLHAHRLPRSRAQVGPELGSLEQAAAGGWA